ncbi:FAD:protein FMN transferase [Pseudopedobacter saltans]|nr:FAD:protein FMN transferase [Pseudopedobacter saltans]
MFNCFKFSSVKLFVKLFLLVFISSGFKPKSYKREQINGFAQGTTYSIVYYTQDKKIDKVKIDSILKSIDLSMSLYTPHSVISKFNLYETKEIELDNHFKKVMEKSFLLYKESKGVFDVTVEPLVRLWGFGSKKVSRLPNQKEIDSVLQYVGMDKLKLQGNKLIKVKDGVKVDLNGIAQGYSVDVLADYLESQSIRHYVIEIGGELRIKGPKPDGSAMKIGIEKPEKEALENELMKDIIHINSGAITTAGNYRKFIQQNDKTISHHINPKNGQPFSGEIISATIYAKDAISADGYDNVIISMKADEAIGFANKHPHLELYLIYKDKTGMIKDTLSTGFKKLLKAQ